MKEITYDMIWQVVDCNKIYKNLYQGSYPPVGHKVASEGFHVLVLAANENQRADMYPGVEVICAPGDDDERPHRLPNFLPGWNDAAQKVADHVKAGRKVLVTCMGGYNRSGFVTASALKILTGWSGEKCVKHVQACREGAFSNELFAKHLSDIP